MKICVFEGEDGWRYRIVAANGRKLAVSEAYASKTNALRAAGAFVDAIWGRELWRLKIEVEGE